MPIFEAKANVDIHIRPAVAITEIAQQSECGVYLLKGKMKCHAKSLLEVEALNIKKGDFVTVQTDDINILKEYLGIKA